MTTDIDIDMPSKLPAEPGGAWRTMDSAPRENDVDILVWHAQIAIDEDTGNRIDRIVGYVIYVTRWNGNHWLEPEIMSGKPAADWLGDDWEYANEPSFWMPLPAPPPNVVIETQTEAA